MRATFVIDKSYDQNFLNHMPRDDFEAAYLRHSDSLASAVVSYQKSWNETNNDFFENVAIITNQPWQFDEYKVVLSPVHKGISNRDGNTIIRSGLEDQNDQKRITAHEILMTHLWKIFDSNFPDAAEDKYHHYWALNEITTDALLSLELSLDHLWTKRTQGYDQYLRNYPQLSEAKNRLKELYLKKSDFRQFVKKGIELIKKIYPNRDLLPQ